MTETPDLDFYDFLLEIRAGTPVCVKCGADLNIEGAKPGQYYRVKCDSVAHAWAPLAAEPPLRMVDFGKGSNVDAPRPVETAKGARHQCPKCGTDLLLPTAAKPQDLEDLLQANELVKENDRLRELLRRIVGCPQVDGECWWCDQGSDQDYHDPGCPWPELEAAVLSWRKPAPKADLT